MIGRTIGLRAIVFIHLLVGAACEKGASSDEPDRDDDFISSMEAGAYTGSAEAKLYLQGYDPLPSVRATGAFSVDRIKGDSVTVVVTADLNNGEGFTLGIPGRQNGKAWKADFETGTFIIKENGEMDGKAALDDKEISWDGHLFEDRIMADIRIKYLQAEGDIPAGSVLLTQLDLARAGTDASAERGCKIVVWETRPVFNLYSGGVDLIQVPVCR